MSISILAKLSSKCQQLMPEFVLTLPRAGREVFWITIHWPTICWGHKLWMNAWMNEWVSDCWNQSVHCIQEHWLSALEIRPSAHANDPLCQDQPVSFDVQLKSISHRNPSPYFLRGFLVLESLMFRESGRISDVIGSNLLPKEARKLWLPSKLSL